MNTRDFLLRISALKQEEKYGEAVNLLIECWRQFSDEEKDFVLEDSFTISSFIASCRKSNQQNIAIRFIKRYPLLINEHTDKYLLNAYGWCLWDRYKEGDKSNPHNNEKIREVLAKEISKVLKIILKTEGGNEDLLFKQLFKIIYKIEDRKPNSNWLLVENFYKEFDIDLLSINCEKNKNGQEQASDIEAWYSRRTKALFKLGKWEHCISLCNAGLNDKRITKFHNDNDSWFLRRIALSQKEQGTEISKILDLLNDILKHSPKPFICKEIAELHRKQGNLEEAFNIASKGVHLARRHRDKINLYALLGSILEEKGDKDMTYKHYVFVKYIGEQENWGEKRELLEKLNEFYQETPRYSKKEFKKLETELQTYWKQFKDNSFLHQRKNRRRQIEQKGSIKKIIVDSETYKNGFIASDDKDYYFAVNEKIARFIQEESQVIFYVLPKQGDEKHTRAKILKVL